MVIVVVVVIVVFLFVFVFVIIMLVKEREEGLGGEPRGRGGVPAPAPPPQPLLALLEALGPEQLLREEPAVATDCKQVVQRREVQRQVRVGGRHGGEEATNAPDGR